jgi:uncharacterized membrane protein
LKVDEPCSTQSPAQTREVGNDPLMKHVRHKRARIDGIARFDLLIGYWFYELLSVILLGASVNLLTSLFDATSYTFARALTGCSFFFSGCWFFVAAQSIKRIYDAAREAKQKNPGHDLRDYASNILVNNEPKTAKTVLASLIAALVLLLVGVSFLAYAVRQPRIAAPEMQKADKPVDGTSQAPPSLSAPQNVATPEEKPRQQEGTRPADNNGMNQRNRSTFSDSRRKQHKRSYANNSLQ